MAGDTHRILSLSNELTALKLEALNNTHEILLLREERRRLNTLVSSHDAVLCHADHARIKAETCLLLKTARNYKDKCVQRHIDSTSNRDVSRSREIAQYMSSKTLPVCCHDSWALLRLAHKLQIRNETRDYSHRSQPVVQEPKLGAPHQLVLELTDQHRNAYDSAAQAPKQTKAAGHACKLGRASIPHQENKKNHHVKHSGLVKHEDIVKSQMAQSKDPSTALDMTVGANGHENEGWVQRGATRTISSLKALVEEKTLALAKSEARFENLYRLVQREVRPDRAETAKLTDEIYQGHSLAINQLQITASSILNAANIDSGSASNFHSPSQKACFTGDSERFYDEANELRSINQQLKCKLTFLTTALVHAKKDYARAMSENEAQRIDLVGITAHLHQIEKYRRCFPNSQPTKLQKSLSRKEAQLEGLHKSVAKLKAEVTAAERIQTRAKEDRNQTQTRSMILSLRANTIHLTQQLHIIRDEVKESRCNNSKLSAQCDKYKAQLDHASEQIESLRCNTLAMESRCRQLDTALTDARAECQDLRTLDSQSRNEQSAGGSTHHVNGLKAEVEILRAQNLALRKANGTFSRMVSSHGFLTVQHGAAINIPAASLKTEIESVTRLQVENQELKLRLGEQEVENARRHSEVKRCMSDNFGPLQSNWSKTTKNPLKHEHQKMRRALEGLRYIVHRQYLEIQNLKQHSTCH